MKAAVYYSQSDIRIEEKPIPKIGDYEVLVCMKACGICGSDLMNWYLEKRAPLVLGHESAGIIARKGRNVRGFDVGDRVFVHHHAACLKCHYCLHEDYTLCTQFHETNIIPGGFAQYFRVPKTNLQLDTLKIPPSLPFDEATLIEPVGCCLRALRKCSIKSGDSLALIGAGSTGIIHLALSTILGAQQTIVSDPIDYRLQAARKFGANVVVNPNREDLLEIAKAETGGRGVDIAVVTAPNIEAYETALRICRRGGKILVFAPTMPHEYLPISPRKLFFEEIQMIPSYSTSHLETREALELLSTRMVDLRNLITHRFTLAKTSEAFKTARESSESLKVVVTNE